MLKTNTKKAIENIRKYIVDNFNGYEDGNSERIKELAEEDLNENFPQLARYINNAFYWEYVHYDTRRNISTFELFKEWAQGLPSVLNCDYYCNRSAVTDLGDILEETEQERNKYSESDAEDMLTRLIYRELEKFDDLPEEEKTELEPSKNALPF